MNTALYQSFNSAFSRQNQDESGESFFDEAKSGLMKDLVDFQSRDDFDQYMRSIEKNYYHKLNLPQPPYESIPEYPPKPQQEKKKKRQHNEDQRKDFIDKVNEVNVKRQQTYSQQQQIQNHKFNQQQQYYQDLSHRAINPHQNPFFDSMVNKENHFGHSTPYSHAPQYQIHTPSIGSQHGGIGFQPHHFNQQMQQPHQQQFHQVPPPYLSKFVAGPTRLEANPLSEPARTFQQNQSPSKQQPYPLDFDLKNPDVQYERYKNLMQNQYYNHNANSNHQGFNLSGAHTLYQPFNYSQQTPPIHQQHQDPNNMSFNPNFQKPQTQKGHQDHIFPNTQQMYHQPSSVSLYHNQVPSHQPHHMQGGYIPPQVYRQMKQNNIVGKDIIESIGGIEDTLKPLEETLKQHELRPFQIQRDYKKEYIQSQKGKSHVKRSHSECKAENMRLVSVSPFRAVVKMDKNAHHHSIDNPDGNQQYDSSEDSDEDQEFHRNQDQQQNMGPNKYDNGHKSRNSPIRNDSYNLRGQKEQFLNTFNEKRSYNQSMNEIEDRRQGSAYGQNKDHQKVRMESEYLRGQREQFLNSFSGTPTGIQIHPNMK